jgi:N-acetylglucosamine repressor
MQHDVQGKVDSRAMREVNRSIVLDIIRRGGRVSRTDLARRSSLTKPTVSAIVDDLIQRGIVQEVGYGKTVASGGRRARLLEFNDAHAAFVGVRFSIHTTSVAVADARGEIRASRELPARASDPERRIEQAVTLVDEALSEAGLPRERVQAAGLTVPGLVDYHTGVIALAPNLEWVNVPLRDMVQEALGWPVVVHNVTNAGAVAEGRVGVAKGARSFVWVYVGSGVGAGIVIDGQVFPGTQGFSGEIGHCPVRDDGPSCSCGLRGCLETLVSGTAIARFAEQAAAGAEPTLLKNKSSRLDAIAVADAARAGDPVAQRILAGVGDHLGMGLSYLINILDPELIVLAGGVMEAAEFIVEPARAAIERHTFKSSSARMVKSTLGERAGLLGAVFAAMDQSVRSYRVVATAERIMLG